MKTQTTSTADEMKEFSEAEYKADVGRVIAHAATNGCAVVTRPDGSARVVISFPPPLSDDE